KSGRHRHLATDRVSDHHLSAECHHPQHPTRAAVTVSERPWRLEPGGLVLAVRLTPKGGRDDIDGIEVRADGGCVLKVRVRAAASEGEANAALVRLLAKVLGVPARSVQLIAGDTARLKRLRVAGEGAALAAALERIVATGL